MLINIKQPRVKITKNAILKWDRCRMRSIEWRAIPSCLKSWATLLPLIGSESSMGVWITCRSPAPNVIVLYRLRERRREKKDGRGGWEKTKNECSFSENQAVTAWFNQCPQSRVSQPQRDGESQKLSRYITNKTQAIPADQDVNGAGQDSMPTTLLQNNTGTTVSMSLCGRENSQHTWQVSCAGDFSTAD